MATTSEVLAAVHENKTEVVGLRTDLQTFRNQITQGELKICKDHEVKLQGALDLLTERTPQINFVKGFQRVIWLVVGAFVVVLVGAIWASYIAHGTAIEASEASSKAQNSIERLDDSATRLEVLLKTPVPSGVQPPRRGATPIPPDMEARP